MSAISKTSFECLSNTQQILTIFLSAAAVFSTLMIPYIYIEWKRQNAKVNADVAQNKMIEAYHEVWIADYKRQTCLIENLKEPFVPPTFPIDRFVLARFPSAKSESEGYILPPLPSSGSRSVKPHSAKK